jgi:hypothetical protein
MFPARVVKSRPSAPTNNEPKHRHDNGKNATDCRRLPEWRVSLSIRPGRTFTGVFGCFFRRLMTTSSSTLATKITRHSFVSRKETAIDQQQKWLRRHPNGRPVHLNHDDGAQRVRTVETKGKLLFFPRVRVLKKSLGPPLLLHRPGKCYRFTPFPCTHRLVTCVPVAQRSPAERSGTLSHSSGGDKERPGIC